MNRLSLLLASRMELIDTSVRVCQENERLARENAALKEQLRRTVIRCQRVTRELADVKEFLSVIELGEAS